MNTAKEKELEEALREVFKKTADEIYGLTADNGKMAIQDNVARDQFLISEKRLVYIRMEALRATVEAIYKSFLN